MVSSAERIAATMALVNASKKMSRWELDDRIKWAFPQLYVRVSADTRGMTVHAMVVTVNDKGGPHHESIAAVTWQPAEVTERLVVEWAARALRGWLETQVPRS